MPSTTTTTTTNQHQHHHDDNRRRPHNQLLLSSFLLLLLLLPSPVAALVDSLTVKKDSRFIIPMNTFGYAKGGTFKLDVKDVRMQLPAPAKPSDLTGGFVLLHVASAELLTELLATTSGKHECLFDTAADSRPQDFFMDLSDRSKWGSTTFEKTIDEAGLYGLVFTVCEPLHTKVWFTADIEQYNPGHDYLGVGQQPIPTILALAATAFWACVVVWVLYLRRHPAQVHRVHLMMTALVVLKALALTSESIMYHFLRARGHTVGWNVVYYIFAFAKGLLLFATVVLVGTGWSLVKPFLSDREKKVLMVVIPLQVIDNVAYIVSQELVPGAATLAWWSNIRVYVDILSCAVILLPMLWSLHTLGRASVSADSKSQSAYGRLVLFRQFYIGVVLYVYFTRFIVYILSGAMPFGAAYVATAADQAAGLAFFCWTGFKFRPASENPYVRVGQDDDDDGDGSDGEFGLDEREVKDVEGMEMVRRERKTSAGAGGGGGGGGRVESPV